MSDETVRLAQAANILRKAITSPIEKQAEQFIQWTLKNFITEKNLRYALDNDLDILTLALNHYGIGHGQLTPLFKMVMKVYWDEAESYLTNVSKVLALLSEKPKCAAILNTVKGRDYLNRCCRTTYDRLYDFIWLDKAEFKQD